MTFNKKPHFPFTYGDHVENDDLRLSYYVVELMKSQRFQSYTSALCFALLTLGSYAQPSSAIPAEYGHTVDEMLNQVNQAAQGYENLGPEIGQAAGKINLGPGAAANAANANLGTHNPLQGVVNNPNQGYNPNMQLANQQTPKMPVTYRFPGPPTSKVGQSINTGVSLATLAYVCLQGYWGNPIFMWGCGGMVLRFILKMGNVNNL